MGPRWDGPRCPGCGSVKIQLLIAEGIKAHTASLACADCDQRWRQELLPIDLERLWRAASSSRGAGQ